VLEVLENDTGVGVVGGYVLQIILSCINVQLQTKWCCMILPALLPLLLPARATAQPLDDVIPAPLRAANKDRGGVPRGATYTWDIYLLVLLSPTQSMVEILWGFVAA
jgi:hypothetical protein